MTWDLKEIFLNECACISKDFELDLSDFKLDGSMSLSSPLSAHLTAENHAGMVLIKLNIPLTVCALCSRCMCDVKKEFNYSFSHIVVPLLGEDMPYEYIEAPGYKLDVYELVKSDILLELPLRILCKDSCRGLCSVCGKNLNEQRCDCLKHTGDSRLQILGQLLK